MLELLGLLAVVIVGGIVLGVVGLVVWLVKVVFKLALLPVWLGITALKGLVLVVLSLLCVMVLGPIVLGIGMAVVIPLLILGAMVWAGVALVA